MYKADVEVLSEPGNFQDDGPRGWAFALRVRCRLFKVRHVLEPLEAPCCPFYLQQLGACRP